MNKEKKLNKEKKTNCKPMTKYVFNNYLLNFKNFKDHFIKISNFGYNDFTSFISDFKMNYVEML